MYAYAYTGWFCFHLYERTDVNDKIKSYSYMYTLIYMIGLHTFIVHALNLNACNCMRMFHEDLFSIVSHLAVKNCCHVISANF